MTASTAFLIAVFVAGWCLGILAGFAFGVWQLAATFRAQTHPRTPTASGSEAAETDGHGVDTAQPQSAERK